ncbi:MAG: prepilin-type N-terminal cleavage/methylation domain-containing protein [Kiritimatiellae bacterium]|nr:prepilin-type N-terminal cleavage/methylation domain-containing protein [Kiritimatiellia bacterium]
MKSGFTLLEVMISTIILSVGLVVLLTSFMNCQRIMNASQDFESAQYVLQLGETAYPLPAPEQVNEDPLESDLLNIDEVAARELLDTLEIDDLPRDRQEDLEKYTFRREVDEVDEEELKRSGFLYTVRTIVAWGGGRGRERNETTVITLWRKQK